MQRRFSKFEIFLLATVAVAAIDLPSAHGQVQFNARATINVTGRGLIPTETDYVPNVCKCENGAASFEALKAQAVAARTYAYYKMHTSGAIADGTSDQVYTCGGALNALHTQAALATEGELLYVYDNIAPVNEVLIAAFYVAGAIPAAGGTPFNADSPGIIVEAGDSDPTNTERWVTYTYANGVSGGSNLGTPLGFQGTPTNPNWPNRGAKSQNGADFLSDRSISYADILKYYYGADIQLRTAATAGTGVTFGVKTLANFDNYADRSGATFQGHESWFNRDPSVSASTTPNVAGSIAMRNIAEKHGGTHSQLISIVYDEASGSDFLLRHVAGARYSDYPPGTSRAADPIANLQFESIGTVGFWLKTDDPGVRVGLALDDSITGAGGVTGERGIWREVIADNLWHKYQWFISRGADWDAWTGSGNGTINGTRVSLDSLQFTGRTDAQIYLDDVFWNPQAVFQPRFAGDFNADGIVDTSDFVMWRKTNGQSGTNLAADADDNGMVDAGDYALWRSFFRQSVAGSEGGGAVPEPQGVVLLLAATGFAFAKCQHRAVAARCRSVFPRESS